MSEALPSFRNSDSQGWLVLSNRIPNLGEETPLLMERMLPLIDLSYPPLCLTMDSIASQEMNEFFDDYRTLTGVDVTIIDLWDINYTETIAAVSQAGLIIFTGGLALDWVAQIAPQASGQSANDFLHKHRLIMAIGPIVGGFGSWVYSPLEGDFKLGLGWIPNAIVLPDQSAPMGDERIRDWLTENERSYAIGLSDDSIFAIGPESQAEVWSTTKPVIALGKGWQGK